MTICNMVIECGAKNGIMELNQATQEYLQKRNVDTSSYLSSDKDAQYEQEYFFDVSFLEPQVACPHNVDNVHPVSKVAGTPID